MPFLKKIVVLKELENGFAINGKKLSGIVRVEQTDGVSELFLSTINITSVNSGSFFLFVIDYLKEVHCFELKLTPYAHGKVFQNEPSIDRGLCAGLCFVKDDLPVTIAFGTSENFGVNLSDFKKMVADTCYNLRRKSQKEKEELAEKNMLLSQLEKPLPIHNLANQYDDEAVATENFYALSDSIKDSLNKVKESQDALLRTENAMLIDNNEKKTQESQSQTYGCENETNGVESQEYSEQNPYYLSVKKDLETILEKFAPEKKLCALFADSRWVKVAYSKEKYYVVGVVKEKNKERYICYGVPEKYSPEPPPVLKNCATFIPLSVFDLKGDGYWMMFQDAITGECIKLKKV